MTMVYFHVSINFTDNKILIDIMIERIHLRIVYALKQYGSLTAAAIGLIISLPGAVTMLI